MVAAFFASSAKKRGHLFIAQRGHYQIAPTPLSNLTVKAGAVEYGKPIVQEVIEL